jgi:hypothetical protein
MAVLPYRGTGLANLPWYALLGEAAIVNQSALTSITATSSVTIHTPGAWTELIASTSGDATLLVLNFGGIQVSATETSLLVNIATGLSGSEAVVASGIAVGGAAGHTDSGMNVVVYLPLRLPASTRVAIQCQSLISADTVAVRYSLYRLGALHMVPPTVDVLGSSTATSRGTVMSGGSGSYVEIIASTARDYRAICIVPSIASSTVGNITATYTAAVGGAGSEADIGSIIARYGATELVNMVPAAPPLPLARYIPAGSRLSVKHDIASGPGNYAACLIGVP